MKKFFMAIFAATVLLTGCSENPAANSADVTEAKTLTTIKLTVNGKTLTATLDDNPTARAFAEMLPLDADMKELNGNEKYFYLDADLPSKPEYVDRINAGDLMLFGSNCVVIFYHDLSNGYSYTRLGRVNPSDLKRMLGRDDVRVKFAR